MAEAEEKPVGVSFPIRLDNDATTLEAAVRSLVDGMRIPYEILLLDDGENTDNTSQIAATLAKQYPTVRVLSIPADYDWRAVDCSKYRWKIYWDGDRIPAPSFLEKLHALPLTTSKEAVLRIGLACVHRI